MEYVLPISQFPSNTSDIEQHTSLSSPSRCTALNIRNYFQTGEVPPEGAVCAPDYRPFDRWNISSAADAATDDSALAELDEALMELMKAPLSHFQL